MPPSYSLLTHTTADVLCLPTVDHALVLRRFDEQVRRDLRPEPPEELVELDARVLRRIGARGGWSGVAWSQLDAGCADAVIEAQLERFAALAGGWEWKHYSWDQPEDLPRRLLAHGFSAEPAEALLFGEIEELALDSAEPLEAELRLVCEQADVDAMVEVHDAVFGGDNAAMGATLLGALTRTPPTSAAFVAIAGGEAVAAGRVEVYPGSEFASLWGGATLPAWRKRGLFRALVTRRAAFARERGVRYLHVDALPSSQPILERVGFARLATTTPYRYQPPARADATDATLPAPGRPS